MEEYDDVSAGPDEQGLLMLSYNAWSELPREVFSFGQTLLQLNISHNNLQAITEDFSTLILLQDLDASNNAIRTIDPAIAKCSRLRKVNLSNNQLATLPNEMSNCVLLETLLCSNNELMSIPPSLGNLVALSKLTLDDNDLVDMPFRLALVPTLKTISLKGNERLGTVPANIRDNSELILWCLRLQYDYQEKFETKVSACKSLETKVYHAEADRLRLEEKVADLTDEVASLSALRPAHYIDRKKKLLSALARVRIICESVGGKAKTMLPTKPANAE